MHPQSSPLAGAYGQSAAQPVLMIGGEKPILLHPEKSLPVPYIPEDTAV